MYLCFKRSGLRTLFFTDGHATVLSMERMTSTERHVVKKFLANYQYSRCNAFHNNSST